MPILSKIIKVPLKKKSDRELFSNTYKEGRVTYVNVNQLELLEKLPHTMVKIECICDECNKPFSRTGNDLKECLCKKCLFKSHYTPEFIQKMIAKQQQTNLERYGMKYASQLESTKQKMIETNLERYGTEWPMQCEKIKEKTKLTCLERYDNEYSIASDYVKKLIQQTCLERYGVNNILKVDFVKEKIANIMISLYGNVNPLQCQEIKRKQLQTLLANPNNHVFSSKQQKKIHSLIGGIFNYPLLDFVIDIAFPLEKVAVEYNGSGHDLSVNVFHTITKLEFQQKDENRYKQLNQLGWKVIVFISKTDKLHDIQDYFQQCLKTNSNLIKIDLDTNEIISL